MKKLSFLILYTIFIILLLVGCSNNNEAFFQKEYITNEIQIKEISISSYNRQIDVSTSDDEQIYIYYSENSKEYYDIYISEENVLTMKLNNNKEWKDYIGNKSSNNNQKISIKIPPYLIKKLTISTTNSNISISQLIIDNISISNNNGNIILDKLNPNNEITLISKNGNISGTIIGSYDDYKIISNIKKGNSNLPSNKNNGNKTLNTSNNNGNINIEFIK